MKLKDIYFKKSYRFLSRYKRDSIDRIIFDYFLYFAKHGMSRFSDKEFKRNENKEIEKLLFELLPINDRSMTRNKEKINEVCEKNFYLDDTEIENFVNVFRIDNEKNSVISIFRHIRNAIAHDNLYVKRSNKITYLLFYDCEPSKMKNGERKRFGKESIKKENISAMFIIKYEDFKKIYLKAYEYNKINN